MGVGAFICFHSACDVLQTRAGFDGWVLLIHESFDTDDQAWPQERLRLTALARRKLRKLENRGLNLELMKLTYSVSLLLDPPLPGDESVWCIEHFQGKMYDYVAGDEQLFSRLSHYSECLRQSLSRSPGSDGGNAQLNLDLPPLMPSSTAGDLELVTAASQEILECQSAPAAQERLVASSASAPDAHVPVPPKVGLPAMEPADAAARESASHYRHTGSIDHALSEEAELENEGKSPAGLRVCAEREASPSAAIGQAV